METYNILIVDDIMFGIEYQIKLLENLPCTFHIATAQTCEEARKKIETQVYDMAILDMHLPDGLGTELIDKIKEKNNKTYIIINTIYTSEYKTEIEKYDGYIKKPINPEHFNTLMLKFFKN